MSDLPADVRGMGTAAVGTACQPPRGQAREGAGLPHGTLRKVLPLATLRPRSHAGALNPAPRSAEAGSLALGP